MLYCAASKNYQGKIWTMTSMLHIVAPDMVNDITQYDSEMYVLTNFGLQFGAFGITQLDILKNHAKWVCSDLAIIPSSVHEVIIIPFDYDVACQLIEYIREVNRTIVNDIDILSDNLYIYKRDTNEVTIFKR